MRTGVGCATSISSLRVTRCKHLSASIKKPARQNTAHQPQLPVTRGCKPPSGTPRRAADVGAGRQRQPWRRPWFRRRTGRSVEAAVGAARLPAPSPPRPERRCGVRAARRGVLQPDLFLCFRTAFAGPCCCSTPWIRVGSRACCPVCCRDCIWRWAARLGTVLPMCLSPLPIIYMLVCLFFIYAIGIKAVWYRCVVPKRQREFKCGTVREMIKHKCFCWGFLSAVLLRSRCISLCSVFAETRSLHYAHAQAGTRAAQGGSSTGRTISLFVAAAQGLRGFFLNLILFLIFSRPQLLAWMLLLQWRAVSDILSGR